MDLGFEVGGSVPAIVKKIREFVDALEVAGNKLPTEADIVAMADVRVRLYRPLRRKKQSKEEKTSKQLPIAPEDV